MMFPDVLVAVGIGDILRFLVPIVFIVIYVLNQLLAAKRKPQQQAQDARRRAARPAERPMRPAQPQGKPQGGAAQLNTEIEQFLKRASQRRGQQPARDRAARAAATPKAPPEPPPRPLRETTSQQPIDVAPIEKRHFGDVAASVQQHLGSEQFTLRAEHLADDVAHLDEQMEEHLQQVFHHRLGKLGGETADASTQGADVRTVAITDAPPAAAAFAQLLRTVQGMRQAIVLSEILTRPEDRW